MVGTKLLLAGCGKMGGALLDGWLNQGIAKEDVYVVEPFGGDAVAERFGVTVRTTLEEIPSGFSPNVVVFAVKPQVMDEVAPPYAAFNGPGTVFMSIAAGRTIASFERLLGDAAAIVRVMPNTPAAVGRGISVACGNEAVTPDQRSACLSLLEAVGESAWVDDEGLLDPVTAVSGSGPAYVFLLIETLAAAGVKAGLAPELAEKLARATVAGSGELARQSDDPASTLRENVTSPGGTTAAALEVLMGDGGMRELLERAVEAATRRSRELAG